MHHPASHHVEFEFTLLCALHIVDLGEICGLLN